MTRCLLMYLTDLFHITMPLFSIIGNRLRQNILYVVKRKNGGTRAIVASETVTRSVCCKMRFGYVTDKPPSNLQFLSWEHVTTLSFGKQVALSFGTFM